MLRPPSISALLFVVLVAESVGQPVDARHFYAANRNGTGVNQWVKRNGYRTIFEFFKINANDRAYQTRILFVLDNDPNRRPYVYDESTGHFLGRWDANGYSNLPGGWQKADLGQIPNRAFPPAMPNPALPYSTDGYPRSAPPPVR